MNLVYRYYRSMIQASKNWPASAGRHNKRSKNRTPYRVGDISWYGYFGKLAMHNKNLIMKHCKVVDVEDVYTRSCVRKLPLTKECDKRVKDACKSCPFNNGPFAFNDPETVMNRYEGCLHCWISVLEDPKANLDQYHGMPAFLRPKEMPKFLR